ncbi:MAG: cyclodeaminase/cyclohydrolase family protein, partial [Chloroflexi bacterium]|nr:cyclodeaminase/cyclohydrolase family protein [Chloroflexota bacterium]
QEFFVDAARWYLQLDRFQPDQILEYRIQEAEARSLLVADEPPIPDESARPVATIKPPLRTPAPFVEAVAEGTAAPGGGAVAALAGTLSAALAEMVSRLTIGKKRYADVETIMQAITAAASDLRGRLLAAIDEDIQAFEAVMDAFRLPKDDPGRGAAIQKATAHAADVPLSVARLAIEAMQLAEKAATQGNLNAASDAGVAALMGLAAVEGAALNVRVNAVSLEDAVLAARYRSEAAALVEQARVLRDNAILAAERRAGIS